MSKDGKREVVELVLCMSIYEWERAKEKLHAALMITAESKTKDENIYLYLEPAEFDLMKHLLDSVGAEYVSTF